jgi:hypothetical protein
VKPSVVAALRLVALIVALPLLGFVHLLTALGIRFAAWPTSETVRIALAIGYAVAMLVALARLRPFARVALLSLLPPLAIWLGYGAIEPKRDGHYPPETSRAARAEFDGSRFTLRDVRHFAYRSETDFDARWEDREYDLDAVRTVDYLVCWWTAGQEIAHTMMSFGFEDGRQLACSIEIRREADEIYGPLEGLFRRYELIYVWGDERDLIGLRTNHRHEEVRLYRTTTSVADARLLLAAYLRETNALADEPVFYNTFTRNCTSSIARHINEVLPRKIPWYARRLRNGFTDRRSFEGGWIANAAGDPDFATLRERSRINDRALAAGTGEDFSTAIRTHLVR